MRSGCITAHGSGLSLWPPPCEQEAATEACGQAGDTGGAASGSSGSRWSPELKGSRADLGRPEGRGRRPNMASGRDGAGNWDRAWDTPPLWLR